MKQDCSNSSVSPKTLSGEAQLAADEIVAITSSSPSHQLRIMQVLNVKYENEWNSSIPGAFCSYCSLGFHVVVFSCFCFFAKTCRLWAGDRLLERAAPHYRVERQI